jgi:pyruvate dehydrogenase E2 component (dihydrolipoamide acetyltransferase)
MAEMVIMPKLGFDMAEGLLVRWIKQEGEPVQKGEILAEIETDKVTQELPSSFDGVMLKHLVDQGTSVPVGAPIAFIGAPGEVVELDAVLVGEVKKEAVLVEAQAAVAPLAQSEEGLPQGTVKASPLARRMAAERGLDLRSVRGSGPGGRIIRRDVEAALLSASAAPSPNALVAVEPQPKAVIEPIPPVEVPVLPDERVALDKLRLAIGRRMVESKQSLPHFYVTHEYAVEALLALRKQINDTLPEDQKVSVNDFIIKAVAMTLREYPNLNASIVGNELVRHGQIHIGVAVSVPGGLLTVVCQNADRKPLRRISAEVKSMAARARSGKVRAEDVEGSTFSISNLGMFDVENFAAIINPPEAAILAVGSARAVPVVVDGELKPGMRMKMTLSADHRVTDGVEAAQFLQALAAWLENPLRLLLD